MAWLRKSLVTILAFLERLLQIVLCGNATSATLRSKFHHHRRPRFVILSRPLQSQSPSRRLPTHSHILSQRLTHIPLKLHSMAQLRLTLILLGLLQLSINTRPGRLARHSGQTRYCGATHL